MSYVHYFFILAKLTIILDFILVLLGYNGITTEIRINIFGMGDLFMIPHGSDRASSINLIEMIDKHLLAYQDRKAEELKEIKRRQEEEMQLVFLYISLACQLSSEDDPLVVIGEYYNLRENLRDS